MKKTGLISVAFIVGIIVGVSATNFWKSRDVGVLEAPPEGYSEPEEYKPSEARLQKRSGDVRIKNLEIAENVHKYHESIELVAFAPGSGWIKFKTRDGITPTISFFSVTEEEINDFNKFARSINEPVRVELSGDALKISVQETEEDIARFAGKEKVAADQKLRGFIHRTPLTRVAFHKDKNGRIFLVKATDEDDKKSRETLALQKK